MNNMKYKLRYLPLFYEDMEDAVSYIAEELRNVMAANDLIDAVENAILERRQFAEAFEPYHSIKERKYIYYRIYVKNYVIYYVVFLDLFILNNILYISIYKHRKQIEYVQQPVVHTQLPLFLIPFNIFSGTIFLKC